MKDGPEKRYNGKLSTVLFGEYLMHKSVLHVFKYN